MPVSQSDHTSVKICKFCNGIPKVLIESCVISTKNSKKVVLDKKF